MQVVCTLVFLLREYNHLDSIRYVYVVSWTLTIDFTINFYLVLGLIAVIFVVVIIASINILGSGLNDVGGKSLLRYISFIVAYVVLTIGTSFYIQSLGPVFSGIWTVISAFVYILYITDVNAEKHL